MLCLEAAFFWRVLLEFLYKKQKIGHLNDPTMMAHDENESDDFGLIQHMLGIVQPSINDYIEFLK